MEGHSDESHLIYDIDQQTRITPLTIQQAYDRAKVNDQVREGMTEIFGLLEKARNLRADGTNESLRSEIIEKVQAGVTNKVEVNQSLKNIKHFNVEKIYPMNKSGGIGVLDRKCKFVGQGVEESEDGKQQKKIKPIKSFHNLIEEPSTKSPVSKLPWIKEKQKYPYRITLIDKNGSDKCVYFEDLQDARQAQIYLIQKYKLKLSSDSVQRIMDGISSEWENNYMKKFGIKLVEKYKKGKERTAQNSPQEMKREPSVYQPTENYLTKQENQSVNSRTISNFTKNMFANRQSNTHSQYVFNEVEMGADGIDFSDSKSVYNASNLQRAFSKNNTLKPRPYRELKQAQSIYVRNLIEIWKQKSHKKIEVKRRIEQQQLQEVSKTVEEPLSENVNFQELENRNNAGKNSNRSRAQSEAVEILPKEKLSFRHIELFNNFSESFKPIIRIELFKMNAEGEPEISKNYNSFLTKKTFSQQQQEFNYGFDLVPELRGEQAIVVEGSLNAYTLKVQVLDFLTEEEITAKQIGFDSLLLKHDLQIIFYSQTPLQNNSEDEEPEKRVSLKLYGEYQNEENEKQDQQQNVLNILGKLAMGGNAHQKEDSSQEESSDSDSESQSQKKGREQVDPFKEMKVLELQGEFKQEEQKQVKEKAILESFPSLSQSEKNQIRELLKQEANQKFDITLIAGYVPTSEDEMTQPTDQEYLILSKTAKVLSKLPTAQQVPSFCPHYLQILKMLEENQVFSDVNMLIENFIAVLIKWNCKFLECSDAPLNLAKLLEFQDQQIDKTSEKIEISLKTLDFMIDSECPQLLSKLRRRNIPITLLCLEYCQYLLIKNLPANFCLKIVQAIFNSFQYSPEAMLICFSAWLCRHWQQELKKCYTFKEVRDLLQNKKMLSHFYDPSKEFETNRVWREMNNLYHRYFSEEGKVRCLRDIEKIQYQFYQRQSDLLDERKANRFTEKVNLTKKFMEFKGSKTLCVPFYKPLPHCLHIYFTSFPKVSGSLYLRTSFTEFECIDYEANPYFILPNIESSVRLQFIDAKSYEYSFELIFDRGFGFFKREVSNKKGTNTLTFQYWAGLLDEQSIETKFKNSKDVEAAISSLTKVTDIKYLLNRQFSVSKILSWMEEAISQKGKPIESGGLMELSRKIRTVFSEYQNKANEYEMFIHFLGRASISLKEKLSLIFQFSTSVSYELFLSENNCLEKIMIYDLLKVMEIPISFKQFEAIYQNLLPLNFSSEINCPKVFKARFFYNSPKLNVVQQIKLQEQLYEYLGQRGLKYVYSDIDLDDLIAFLKPIFYEQIKNEETVGLVTEGTLKLVIGSDGEIQYYSFTVNIKNHNKDFVLDQNSLTEPLYSKQMQNIKPQILKTSIDPELLKSESLINLSKKNTKQDFKPSNALDQRRGLNRMSNNSPTKSTVSLHYQVEGNDFESINLFRFIIKKSKRLIPMRYKRYPKNINFGSYYAYPILDDLNNILLKMKVNQDLNGAVNPKIQMNNEEIKSFEAFHRYQNIELKFGLGPNAEMKLYKPELGMANNLKELFKDGATHEGQIVAHFYTYSKDQIKYPVAKVFVNYGFGVLRWEKCKVKGTFRLKLNDPKPGKTHKQIYLILLNEVEKIIEHKYLKGMDAKQAERVPNLGQISEKNISKWQKFKI